MPPVSSASMPTARAGYRDNAIGGLASVQKMAVLDGTNDGAAIVGDAVKPCTFGAPLRGCGA